MKSYIVWFMLFTCISFDMTAMLTMRDGLKTMMQSGDQHLAAVLAKEMLQHGDNGGGASAYKSFFDQRNIRGIARQTAILTEARVIFNNKKRSDVDIASAVNEEGLDAVATTEADGNQPTLDQHLGALLYDEQGVVTKATISEAESQIDDFNQAVTRHWVYRLKQAFAQYKAGHSEGLKVLLLEDLYHNPVIALPIVSRYFKNDQVFFRTLVKLATTEEEHQRAAEIIGMEKERIAFIDRDEKKQQQYLARMYPALSSAESTRRDAANSIQRVYRKKRGGPIAIVPAITITAKTTSR